MFILKKQSVLILMIATLIVSCKSKDEGSNDNQAQQISLAPLTVSGPNLDGRWETQCFDSQWGNGLYRRIILTAEGNNITYTEKTFREDECIAENVKDREEYVGTYSYKKVLSNNSYQVDLSIPLKDNISAIRTFNLEKDNDFIYISDFYFNLDESDTMPIDIELSKKSKEEVLDIKPGLYQPLDSDSDFFNHSISTLKVDDSVVEITIEVLSSTPFSFSMNCSDYGCYDGTRKIKFLKNNSYEYITSDGEKVIFSLDN